MSCGRVAADTEITSDRSAAEWRACPEQSLREPAVVFRNPKTSRLLPIRRRSARNRETRAVFLLVLGGLLDVINDQRFDWAASTFELES